MMGGEEIYQQAIPLTERMYLSYIKKEYRGDTFFPEWNTQEWEVEQTEDYEEWTLVIYRRIKQGEVQL